MSLGNFEQTADETDFKNWLLPSQQDVVACCNDLVSLYNLAELGSAPGWRGWHDGESACLINLSDVLSPELSLTISLAAQPDETGRYQTHFFVDRSSWQPTEAGRNLVESEYHLIRETGHASWLIKETEYVELLDQGVPQLVLCGSQSRATYKPVRFDQKELLDVWSLAYDLRQALKTA